MRKHPMRRLLRFRPTKESSESIGSTTATSNSQDDGDWDDVYADVRPLLDSKANSSQQQHRHSHQVPWLVAYTCYLAYAILLLLGQWRDWLSLLLRRGRYYSPPSDKYAKLLNKWEATYTRRIYHRIQDCFNRPLASRPGTRLLVLERASCDGKKSFQVLRKSQLQQSQVEEYTNNPNCMAVANSCSSDNDDENSNLLARDCLNLGSYNYLGFADDFQSTCRAKVVASMDMLPISTGSSLQTFGRTVLHDELERSVASFCGKPAALCFNMGYNTNATVLPALLLQQNGSSPQRNLIVSDALNHTSIVNGARASGATIRTFAHDDVSHLESVLRQAIVQGVPRTRRPWHKILVVIEGVYSMEGEYSDLRNIVRVAKKYGAYVYLDEAHSIGAMGATGRGITEYCNVDPADVDVMMGTFTKSFGAMGGYICASKEIIDYLRVHCAGSVLHTSMSPVVCQQIITAFKVITGQDGTNIGRQKLQALRDNSNYFRLRLERMGLQVLGQYDSPVIPVMLYHMTKIASFSRECFKRGIAVVVVGAPAVPVLECRARFCMSAAHKRKDLDWALDQLEEIVDICRIRHGPRLDVQGIDVVNVTKKDD
ncbi:hypothetical protein MPSEU_000162300 [Mayamaea pseudoterrestris]|nr:hypothetical protein MPSEU_000162300 [Mayamaea pseudoterrestris]